jgi:uncharacterized protein (TIGR02284 family)
MRNDHDINVLNGLIATTLDSADGYAEAAKNAKSESLTSLFRSRANERRKIATTLQDCVRSLGGKAEDDGTVLASAHRMFVNLRTSLTKDDNKAVLNEVERGEDHIKHKFEDALNDRDLSQHTHGVVSEAYISVRSGHDQMHNLQQAMDAT